MQNYLVIAIASAILYFGVNMLLRRFPNSDEPKSNKQLMYDTLLVFVVVFGSAYVLGFAGLYDVVSLSKTKPTPAFTSKPDF